MNDWSSVSHKKHVLSDVTLCESLLFGVVALWSNPGSVAFLLDVSLDCLFSVSWEYGALVSLS